ncbi:hypothetical protein MYX06_03050 [Patescibacteria group bacterium AH-259-L05]|nr:hypothetical protein [Patescibacteria group bacterium AH-259-L05]
MYFKIPTLFFPQPFEPGIKDAREEDVLEAFKVLTRTGVPFILRPDSDVAELKLNSGHSEYRGLDEVRKFAKNHQKRQVGWVEMQKKPLEEDDDHSDCGINGD